MKSSNQSGFTLVELAVVIVIIGLIVAGVTAGQMLVKQANLRALITQADQIRSAVNSFKLQYNGLPGDITNGYSYWTTCGASAAVCNGDGDKQIEVSLKTGSQQPEGYIAWWQLSQAGVFPGTYTIPGSGSGSTVGVINSNIPQSKYPGVGISLGYNAGTVLSSTHTGGAKNFIIYGRVATTIANGVFLTPPQAASIDDKADDGNPSTGSVLGGFTDAGVLTTCGAGGAYVLTTAATETCSMGFAL